MLFGHRDQASTGILPLRSDITAASSPLSEGPGPLDEDVPGKRGVQGVSH